MFDKLWKEIKPSIFRYKKIDELGLSDEKIVIGVMAQDIREGLSKGGYNPNDFSVVQMEDTGYYSVDYIQLIPILINRVKKLESEIEKMKNGEK